MKVLMIDALGTKGQALYDYNLCANLSKLPKTEVILQVPSIYKYESDNFIINKLSDHTSNSIAIFIRIVEYIKWLVNLCKTNSKFKPDVIHWQFGFFCLFDLFCNFILKVKNRHAKFTLTIHDINPARPTINNTLARRAFFCSFNDFIIHSEETKLLFFKWMGHNHTNRKVSIIPHGPYLKPNFRKKSKKEIKNKLGIWPDGPIVITVGSINENKDIKKSLMFIAELQKFFAEINYVIAGHSKSRKTSELFKLAGKVPNPERINIINRYISDEEVDDLYYIADFSLLIYKESSTSGAAIRSLCMGVPVVCNDKQGFISIVKDGQNGIILKGDNFEESAEKVYRLLKDKACLLEMKQKALKSYQSITWEEIAKKHRKFYYEITKVD